ncbi:Peptidase M50 [Georgfuchsia toluolica]|uniref:Peptidase M50 n=1 Tax=Georgfuchsia toluolica TaxID=424218 RepID=A0A916J388_9PROT|nr:site-2 protease family protein [Georgfuchsia toluolica]CAG4883010.1 Peptidase M50 [Georgfuchsia toluolica]
MENSIQALAISALPILFAITLHEAAHGYVARMFGDPTAWKLGRVSLNPLRHIDPLGTILLPAVTYLLSGFMFGWAKPVPVDFGKLHRPKRDMLWVAAAGPGANLLMALAWALLLKLVLGTAEFHYSEALRQMALAGIAVNGMFMVLNLLPLLPLDGGRILVSLLPQRAAWTFAQTERYGMWILILLLLTHVLDAILRPMIGLFLTLIESLFGF